MRNARAFSADTSELALVESMWRATNRDFAGARDELQHAADAAPEDARLWNALGWLTLRSDFRPGIAKEKVAADLAPVVAKLASIASSASELDLLARASLFNGQPTAAIAYEKRAVKVDPNCLDCLQGAATAMLAKGLAREALEVATFAEGLAPEGVRPRALVEVADRARAAVAAKSEALPAAPASVESAQKP